LVNVLLDVIQTNEADTKQQQRQLRLSQQSMQASQDLLANSQKDVEQSVQQYLLRLETIVKVFEGLIELTKMKDQKNILNVAMKQGKSFVDAFMRCTPFLANHFKDRATEIRSVLRTLQVSTRILQNLCAHAKVLKDPSLTNVVPGMRKVLETLIFKVKGILQANNALKAFTVGNLKHRNLKGEVVSSQMQDADEEEDEVHNNAADEEPNGQDLHMAGESEQEEAQPAQAQEAIQDEE